MELTLSYPVRGAARIAPLALALCACKGVEPAPRDLDALLHRFWTGFDADDDLQVQESLRALAEVHDEDALLDAHVEGEPSRLSVDEAALVAIETTPLPDPARARGLATVTRFTCAPRALTLVLTAADQNAIYKVYDAYSRDFDEEPEAFVDGEVQRAGWQGEIAATIPLVGNYTYGFRTELRRVPLPDDFPDEGDAVLARTFMRTAAVWNKEGPTFPQDYQMEIYYPIDGDIVHTYGVWREMDTRTFGDMEGDLVVRTTINQTVKWDQTTEEACESR